MMCAPHEATRSPASGASIASPIRALCFVAALLFGVASATSSAAQTPPPLDRPSEPGPEVPFLDDEPPSLEVPPSAPIEPQSPVSTTLRSIRVEGNTLLPKEVIESIVTPYLEEPLRGHDLEGLRLALSQAYIDRGYVTSGALLPDQDLSDGHLVVQVREGRIARVKVDGLQHLRASYVRSRVSPEPDEPVHVPSLELRLQLLQHDTMIDTVHARLEPGDGAGESVLIVRIEESARAGADVEISNDRAPSIGAENVSTVIGLRDATGFGDLLSAGVRISTGLRDIQAGWGVPVNRHDTRFGVRGRWARSQIIEAPFDALDIESEFAAVEVALSHPVFRDDDDDVRVGVAFEWRQGRNTLGGVGFSFAEGADRGRSVVAPIRLAQSWTRRNRSEVIALRSKLSIGLPIAGATNVAGAEADANYVSWIFQGQWARRFESARGIELFSRTNLQLASDPLLPIEQYSLGGHASVRGYRENTLVSDDGVDASIELRLPVWSRADGSAVVQLAPFVDVGHGWSNPDRSDSVSATLASVGIGLRTDPTRWLHGELYWGYPLIGSTPSSDPLQDHGIYFSIVGSNW